MYTKLAFGSVFILVCGCQTWGPNGEHMSLYTCLQGIQYVHDCPMVYEPKDVSHVAEVVWPHVLKGECHEALSHVLRGTGLGFHYLPDGVIRIFKLSDMHKRISGVAVAKDTGKRLINAKLASESGVYTYSGANGEFTLDYPATDSQALGYYGDRLVGKFSTTELPDSVFLEFIVPQEALTIQ